MSATAQDFTAGPIEHRGPITDLHEKLGGRNRVVWLRGSVDADVGGDDDDDEGMELQFHCEIPTFRSRTEAKDRQVAEELGCSVVQRIKVVLAGARLHRSPFELRWRRVTGVSFDVDVGVLGPDGAPAPAQFRVLDRRWEAGAGFGDGAVSNALLLYLDPSSFAQVLRGSMFGNRQSREYTLKIKNIIVSTNMEYRLLKENKNMLAKDIAKTFCSDELMDSTSDFKIECSGGVVLQCHKLILASRSDVFRAMLEHDTVEKKFSRLLIKDASSEVLKYFLQFLYTDKLPGDCNQDMWEPCLELSVKYQVSPLTELMAEILLSSLRISNAAHLLGVANMYNLESLANSVMDFALKHAKKVSKTDDFVQLQQDHPEVAKEFLDKVKT